MDKPTREEAEKLIGKRTPLPGGKGIGADMKVDAGQAAEKSRTASGTKLTGDPVKLKETLKKRMGDEYKSGGKVCGKKYASGGSVRGSGCESRGKTKGTMR